MYLTLSALLMFGVACSSVDGDDVNGQADLPNGVYFEGAEADLMSKIAMDEATGAAEAEIGVRAANLLNEETRVRLTVDDEALKHYNAEHGVSYQLLPKKYYTLSKTELAIAVGNVSAQKIKVSISSSVSELDETVKYAIPLRLESVSGTGSLPVLQSSAIKIFALERPITTSALVQRNTRGGFYLWTEYPGPMVLKEWTISYGFMADRTDHHNQAMLSTEWEKNKDLGFFSRLLGNAGSAVLQFKVGGTDDPNAFLKTRIKPNQWYHIAFVYKGERVTTYVNGVRDNEFAVPPAAETVGELHMSWGEFSGLVREIRIYSKALPASVIRENLFIEDPANPSLVAYYPLSKKTGLRNVARDEFHLKAYKQGSSPKVVFPTESLTWQENIKFSGSQSASN